MLFVELVLAVLLAKVDATQITALTGVGLAGLAALKAFSMDPRAARLAERKENIELQDKVDVLYREKRSAEDREREALRRLDATEHKLEVAEQRITRMTGELDGNRAEINQLRNDVRKWRLIAGDIRGNRD